MRLLLLQGPGLNLLDERTGDVPGVTAASLEAAVRAEAARCGVREVRVLQSNHEGALVDALQEARSWASFVVMNPGALTHTSRVLHDAVAACGLPVVEVHLSDLNAREPWRRGTVLADVVRTRILGRGVQGYLDAVRWLVDEAAGRAPSAVTPAAATRLARVLPGGARDCAFCADEPCELHREHAFAGAPPGSGAALGMELRALEAEALLAETDASIARVRAGAARLDEGGVSSGGGRAAPRSLPVASSSPVPTGMTTAPAGSTAAAAPPPDTGGRAPVRKTMGRQKPAATPGGALPDSSVPSRAQLAEKLAQHLAGTVGAAELSAFAREGWLALDGGADVPAADRLLLEEALRRLMFAGRSGPGAPDAHEFVSLLARLQ